MAQVTVSQGQLAQEGAALSRVITILDPQGPLRYRDIQVQPDSLPSLLLHLIQNGDMHHRTLFQDMLRSDLPASWIDIQPAKPHTVNPKLGWDISVARHLIHFQTLGFGIERLLLAVVMIASSEQISALEVRLGPCRQTRGLTCEEE